MGNIEATTQHIVDGLQTARDIFDHFVAHLKSRAVLDEFEDTLRPMLAAVEAHRIEARDGLTEPVVAILVQGRANAGDFQQVMVFDKACQTHHNAACVLLARFTECFIVDGPHEFYTQTKGTYDCYTLPVWINAILFPETKEHPAYADGEPCYYFAVWERLRAFPMQQIDNLRAAVVIEGAAARAQVEQHRGVRHEIDDPIEPQVAAKMVADADVGWSENTARTRLSAMAVTGQLASNGKIGTRDVRYSLAGVEMIILKRKEDRADRQDEVKVARKRKGNVTR